MSGSERQILTSNFVDVKLRRQIFDVFDVPQAQFQGLGAQIGALGAQIQAKTTISGPDRPKTLKTIGF